MRVMSRGSSIKGNAGRRQSLGPPLKPRDGMRPRAPCLGLPGACANNLPLEAGLWPLTAESGQPKEGSQSPSSSSQQPLLNPPAFDCVSNHTALAGQGAGRLWAAEISRLREVLRTEARGGSTLAVKWNPLLRCKRKARESHTSATGN